ncbi:hypothetical protein [Pedobacter frigidisoli]|uniref:hypothetical protein n=1 Tax=Pedobacter frigidisoli TaxID=2530455 RepID=UPI00292EA887|nr:hypothetical protein [Pedobacter frigidisoli]
MNRVVIIFLFPVIIFNTSVREVLKLPQLVSHFCQHQQINSHISFLDFLEMHYLGEDLDDDDEEEDMKLPFKKVDGHHVISICVPAEKFTLLKATCVNLLTDCAIAWTKMHTNPITGSLFRPPMGSA